jgi:hypothetical protein
MELKNDHNVYILGAGFSHGAGLPLIGNFLLRMRDSHEWLENKGRHLEAKAVASVLEFRLIAASAAYWVNMDLENIEELFSLASASAGHMDVNVRLAIAATLDFTQQSNTRKGHLYVSGRSKVFVGPAKNGKPVSAPSWARFDEKAASVRGYRDDFGPFEMGHYGFRVARLLGMFANGEVRGENSFISFNYDLLLENALRELGLQFCYGFSPQTVNFQEGAWGQAGESAVQVLKLHGSVNWARRKGRRGRSFTVFRDYSDVLAAGLSPELVPPTWKKVFEKQLQAVWMRAVERLSSATRIVIIGFSMPPTDMHFKYLMAAGLQNNVSLRQIVCVNPGPTDALESRLRGLLREAYVDTQQIKIEQVPLESFTSDQLGHLQSIGRPPEYGTRADVETL